MPELKKSQKIYKTLEIDDENILKLDDQYPLPIVNHENAREKALNALKFDLNIALAILNFPRANIFFFFFNFLKSSFFELAFFCIFFG